MTEAAVEKTDMSAGEKAHPPIFVQAHLPGGTPAACGDAPMKERGDSSQGEGHPHQGEVHSHL